MPSTAHEQTHLLQVFGEPPVRGLTPAEVEQRRADGQTNAAPLRSSRPLSAIIRENLLSLTNTILLGIMVTLVLVGKPDDALATGGIVFFNIVIGIFQEIRAKRQLDRIALLNRPKVTVIRDGHTMPIDPDEVVLDDVLWVRPGDQIVVDGVLLTEKQLDVDESLLTGESDHVPKTKGDELLSGSFCVAGSGVYRATRVGREGFAYRLTEGAREYRRVLTPLQRQISVIVRLLVVLASSLAVLMLLSFAIEEQTFETIVQNTAVVISLVPQGLLLMITVAYALGAVRMARKGALVQQINAVESLSNVDVLCLDKTGTLTTNRIQLRQIIPLGHDEGKICKLLGDFIATTGTINRTAEAIAAVCVGEAHETQVEIPFASSYKWSGITVIAGELPPKTYVLGAPEILLPHVKGGSVLEPETEVWTDLGLRVLLFATHDEPLSLPEGDALPSLPEGLEALAWITFSDELRPDAREVLQQFRQTGVEIKLISGDNPQTVAALAQLAGISHDVEVVSGIELAELTATQFEETVDHTTVFGRISPDQKQRIIQALRARGHYVAMIGDGVNDVLSLKQAHMGIAMESGSQATRAVADMILLDDRLEVLPEAIEEGQRILNGMQDNMRLFLSRTLYAALLIIVAGFIGTEFPFTPKHNLILTTLPVGIPAFFLTVWARAGSPQRNLLRAVAEFCIPAGFSIMIVTLIVYLLYVDQVIILQRTILTTTALLCGLLLIIFAEYPVEDWEKKQTLTFDRRRVLLAFVMLVLYALIFPFRPLREFFELNTLAWRDLGTIAAAVAAWAVAVQSLWRHDLLHRIILPPETLR